MMIRPGLLARVVAGVALPGIVLAPEPGFRFSPEASAALRELWRASLEAGAERVACLAARVEGDTVHITRIHPLPADDADSLGIGAQASIDLCGPPEWQGTVHTHVAEYRDGKPSSRFSGQDRVVMRMWYERWRTDGVFCVVYSADKARCEADGVVGGLRSRPRIAR